MATNYGLQEFSTQEAVNFEAYKDWNWEILDLSTDETDDTSIYITADNPAKKIVLYVEPTITGVSSLDVNDVLTMTLNGQTDAHKKIKIDPNDLPFTLTGIQLTSFAIQSATGESSDSIALLSFH
tara:strand:+ start:122 stop:496 length:375 start_codon:yes stop_codon:yes gene_type:complete